MHTESSYIHGYTMSSIWWVYLHEGIIACFVAEENRHTLLDSLFINIKEKLQQRTLYPGQ